MRISYFIWYFHNFRTFFFLLLLVGRQRNEKKARWPASNGHELDSQCFCDRAVNNAQIKCHNTSFVWYTPFFLLNNFQMNCANAFCLCDEYSILNSIECVPAREQCLWRHLYTCVYKKKIPIQKHNTQNAKVIELANHHWTCHQLHCHMMWYIKTVFPLHNFWLNGFIRINDWSWSNCVPNCGLCKMGLTKTEAKVRNYKFCK